MNDLTYLESLRGVMVHLLAHTGYCLCNWVYHRCCWNSYRIPRTYLDGIRTFWNTHPAALGRS
jgi:hypothetical protein